MPPEVVAFPCIDPVETAADKVSALAWRVAARRRGSPNDDPTIIRHLQDLAALKGTAAVSEMFVPLVHKAMVADEGRRGQATASSTSTSLFANMLEQLSIDPLWARDYKEFVDGIVRDTSRADRLRRLARRHAGSWLLC